MYAFENIDLDEASNPKRIRPDYDREIARVRRILDTSGYVTRVYQRLSLPPKRRSTEFVDNMAVDNPMAETASDVLMQLFFYGQAVRVAAVRKALAPMSVEEWELIGLLEQRQDYVSPNVMLTPYKGLILASDTESEIQTSARPDVVMGLGTGTLWLASLTVRRHVRHTLDLGTGCGLQALIAAAHSDQVTAVDINPRALDFGRFNAKLNGIANVEFAEGDFFEPVAERKFDLIVSHPPYLISPESRWTYRENPFPGDELLQRIVQAVPRFLKRGGFSQIIGDWIQPYGEDWRERLRNWVPSGSCDTWAMLNDARRPADYVENRMNGNNRQEFDKHFPNWMSYYRQSYVELLISGIINIRRSARRHTWYRASIGSPKLLPDAGQDIEQGFKLQDFLARLSGDQALLDTRFRVCPYVRIVQQSEPRDRDWRTVGAQLTRMRGIALSAPISSDMVDILLRVDGDRPIGDLIRDWAARKKVAFEDCMQDILTPLRQLIADGFLVPLGSEEIRTLFEEDTREDRVASAMDYFHQSLGEVVAARAVPEDSLRIERDFWRQREIADRRQEPRSFTPRRRAVDRDVE